ncbi:transporter [Prevotella disiens]|uniref:Transporter n=1 Tax=Prevotella disiens TaxID=28130 RepID=A0A3E4QM82_9BACT|nr:transporter [Prevotella disiens]RGL04794.1 transporter [Prevotella disiens]
MELISILKKWTLPIAIATGGIVYLLFAFIPLLAPVSDISEPVFNFLLPICMFLMLYVTFCKVDFRKLIPVKWHFWIGVFQVLFVFIVVGIILFFKLQGDGLILMESVLACIICPCASAAAIVTQKLGGSIEDMTTYTFLSNFICAALIPTCFPLIEPNVNVDFMESFLIILNRVCMVLVAPMLVAYFTKHWRILRPLYNWIISVRNLGFYFWAFTLTIVTGTTVKNIVHADTTALFLVFIALLGLLLCLIQFAVGRFIGRFFGSTIESGQALGQKNTTFAIWIAFTYLNPLSSVGPGCYILWQNIINSIEMWYYEKHSNKE